MPRYTLDTPSQHLLNQKDKDITYYGILLDGRVQITGALFNSKAQVVKAIKKLNNAIEQGLPKVEVEIHRGMYLWDLQEHNQGIPVKGVEVS
jgi:hypothetical protein